MVGAGILCRLERPFCCRDVLPYYILFIRAVIHSVIPWKPFVMRYRYWWFDVTDLYWAFCCCYTFDAHSGRPSIPFVLFILFCYIGEYHAIPILFLFWNLEHRCVLWVRYQVIVHCSMTVHWWYDCCCWWLFHLTVLFLTMPGTLLFYGDVLYSVHCCSHCSSVSGILVMVCSCNSVHYGVVVSLRYSSCSAILIPSYTPFDSSFGIYIPMLEVGNSVVRKTLWWLFLLEAGGYTFCHGVRWCHHFRPEPFVGIH